MDKKNKKLIFKKTLEDRDREDQLLFGWKGGKTSYAKKLDLDSYLGRKEDKEEE